LAVDRRLLAGSLAAAALIVVGAGWYLSTGVGDEGVESVDMGSPTIVQDPTLGTNAPVHGEPLPEVTLRDTDGNDVALADLEGEPLVINFWYSGCVPCKQEMPELGAAADRLTDQVTFIGVNLADSADVAQEFADEHGAKYLQLLDTNGELASEVGVNVQPTTLFVAPDGSIVRQKAGELSADALDTALAEAFPGVN
jgi:peroxiredoxin